MEIISIKFITQLIYSKFDRIVINRLMFSEPRCLPGFTCSVSSLKIYGQELHTYLHLRSTFLQYTVLPSPHAYTVNGPAVHGPSLTPSVHGLSCTQVHTVHGPAVSQAAEVAAFTANMPLQQSCKFIRVVLVSWKKLCKITLFSFLDCLVDYLVIKRASIFKLLFR